MVTLALLMISLAQKLNEHTMHHTPEEFARVLDDPARDAWQKPHEVVMALALKPGEVVADIGAGTGYFSKRFARHAGKVYAVDIAPMLLDQAKKNAPTVEIVLAAPDDPHLPNASIDTIFICNTLHHIEQRPAYYAKLAAALKPGGRVVIIDFHKRPTPVGPPLGDRISESNCVKEFQAAGFKKTREWKMLPTEYFLEFQR